MASLLTAATGVHVMVQYKRAQKRYQVVWEGGPATEAMRDLVSRHLDQVTALEAASFDWSRAPE